MPSELDAKDRNGLERELPLVVRDPLNLDVLDEVASVLVIGVLAPTISQREHSSCPLEDLLQRSTPSVNTEIPGYLATPDPIRPPPVSLVIYLVHNRPFQGLTCSPRP